MNYLNLILLLFFCPFKEGLFYANLLIMKHDEEWLKDLDDRDFFIFMMKKMIKDLSESLYNWDIPTRLDFLRKIVDETIDDDNGDVRSAYRKDAEAIQIGERYRYQKIREMLGIRLLSQSWLSDPSFSDDVTLSDFFKEVIGKEIDKIEKELLIEELKRRNRS